MGITHHDCLTVAGTIVSAKLNVTGTTHYSGQFEATATNQISRFTKISVAGTTSISGKLIATGAGKPSRVKEVLIAAGSSVGLKTVAAASSGSVTVLTNKAVGSSRIFLTPITTTQYPNLSFSAYVSTVASGSSFTIKLMRLQTAGTRATASGRVAWWILNV